jgi:hypothetical protein
VHTITSFHSSSVRPDQLNAIIAEYTALERVRIFRRLFVARFGLLAVAFAAVGAGLGVLPAFATWFSVALCLAPPIAVLMVELRHNRRLARCLAEIPGGVAHEAAPLPCKKVIKSS